MRSIGPRVVSLAISGVCHALLAGLLLVPRLSGLPEPRAELRTVAIVSLPELPAPSAADTIAENLELDQTGAAGASLELPSGPVNLSRIRARQDALFPLLTQDLPSLEAIWDALTDQEDRLTWFNPGAASSSDTGLPPLQLTNTELTHLVDAAWSRRERWRSFAEIATLLTRHDPDVGRAADLVRAHLDRNLLQPYGDTTPPDARFWVLLNLAADQELVIRFVARFVREHPSSRASTELLFFLDELAQANRETLLVLIATDPARDLTLTRRQSPDAYRLAAAIHRHYLEWLQARQLDGRASIHRHYDDVRMRLLSTILDTTPQGYGAADARYLLGRILWDQGLTSEAMEMWRGIGDDERGLYAAFYEPIAAEAVAPADGSAARIAAAFGAERLRWRRFSDARLRQFGYTRNSF